MEWCAKCRFSTQNVGNSLEISYLPAVAFTGALYILTLIYYIKMSMVLVHYILVSTVSLVSMLCLAVQAYETLAVETSSVNNLATFSS